MCITVALKPLHERNGREGEKGEVGRRGEEKGSNKDNKKKTDPVPNVFWRTTEKARTSSFTCFLFSLTCRSPVVVDRTKKEEKKKKKDVIASSAFTSYKIFLEKKTTIPEPKKRGGNIQNMMTPKPGCGRFSQNRVAFFALFLSPF